MRIAMAAFFVFDQESDELLGERLYMDTELLCCGYKEKRLLPPNSTNKLTDWNEPRSITYSPICPISASIRTFGAN